MSFSGTQNPIQLMTELINSAFVDYELHDIEGAKAMKYFYDHYLSDFRDEFT